MGVVENMKVWITKYALTDGIKEATAKKSNDGYGYVTDWHEWFSEEDCFTDKFSAIQKAEKMRKKKIASLKKQIEKLEKMRFE